MTTAHGQNEEIDTGTIFTVNKHYLDFPISYKCLFCSRIHSRSLHCIQLSCLFYLLQSRTVSLSSFFFHDLDSFEICWSDILQNASHFGFVWCFSHDQTEVVDFILVSHSSPAHTLGEKLIPTSRQTQLEPPRQLISIGGRWFETVHISCLFFTFYPLVQHPLLLFCDDFYFRHSFYIY